MNTKNKSRSLGLLVAGLLVSLYMPMPEAQAQAAGGKEQKKKGTSLIGSILNKRKKGGLVQAVSNAKQLYFLMIEFDQDFGAFPSDSTAKDDEDLAGYTGKHSNDYLGQFIAASYTKSEEIFFAKGGSSTDKKPDNDTSTKAKTLEAGECGFAYVKDQSTSDNSGRVLLCAPMTGKGFKFDPKPYDGRAVVLRIDGAVKQYAIDENGDVVLPSGKKLFEGGAGSVWGSKGFDAKNLVFPK